MDRDEFLLYFEKSKIVSVLSDFLDEADTIGANLSDGDFDVALIGIPYAYGSESWNKGTENAPDEVRKYLYSLSYDFPKLRIADFGNVVAKDEESLICALTEIAAELFANKKKAVFIGGSKYFSLPILKGMSRNNDNLNFVLADSVLDFSSRVADEDGVVIPTYLDEISLMESVKNIDILGYQNYFTPKSKIKLVNHRRIEAVRLASLCESIVRHEPTLRDSDFFAMTARTIRFSDFPATSFNPNGLFGYDACYLSKLTGISDRNSFFMLSEFNPHKDFNDVSAHLSAQIVWHYLQGVSDRIGDYPMRSLEDYQKYIVYDPPTKTEIIFYENYLNGRWWVKIPMKAGTFVYACSRADYEKFLNREVPDIWYRHFMK